MVMMFTCYLKGCERNTCGTYSWCWSNDWWPLGNPCILWGPLEMPLGNVTNVGLGSWGTGHPMAGTQSGWAAGWNWVTFQTPSYSEVTAQSVLSPDARPMVKCELVWMTHLWGMYSSLSLLSQLGSLEGDGRETCPPNPLQRWQSLVSGAPVSPIPVKDSF